MKARQICVDVEHSEFYHTLYDIALTGPDHHESLLPKLIVNPSKISRDAASLGAFSPGGLIAQRLGEPD